MKVFYEHSETCSPGKSECFKSSFCRSWRGWIRCAAVEFGRSSRGCWRTWELIKSCWTCCRCPTTRWDGSPPKQKQWVGGAFSSVDCQNAASEGFWLGDDLKCLHRKQMNWNVLIGEMQHSSWNANCSPVRRLWFWFWFWAFWPFDRPVPCCWNFEKAVQQNEINTRPDWSHLSLCVCLQNDMKMLEIIRYTHLFLQKFCMGNQENQTLLHKNLNLFLNPGVHCFYNWSADLQKATSC